jgi:hypothetical protein
MLFAFGFALRTKEKETKDMGARITRRFTAGTASGKHKLQLQLLEVDSQRLVRSSNRGGGHMVILILKFFTLIWTSFL